VDLEIRSSVARCLLSEHGRALDLGIADRCHKAQAASQPKEAVGMAARRVSSTGASRRYVDAAP
jgi:hypothetical protein